MTTQDAERESVINRIYNSTIRPFLPRKLAMENGVATRSCRLLDRRDVAPDAEAPCVAAIHDHVQAGDDVVIVGGGHGVTPVHAARRDATVTVFEAAREHVQLVEETLTLNHVQGNVTVEHAVVGPDIDTWGDTDSADALKPRDLPGCDYLEIDAEGSELAILQDLRGAPRVISVESHPHLGVTERDVRDALDALGYEIASRGVEEPGKAIVLTAVRRGDR